jgi:tetratricopeptide (TPR) repeat protein
MANTVRNQPGTERVRATQEEPEVNPLDNVLSFYEQHKKNISTGVTIIAIAVIGFFAYQQWYKAPNEENANKALAMPQLYFQIDSLNLALNGDGKNLGFAKIQTKFSGTAAGNLAHYYAGICQLKMGDFKGAVKSLGEFDGKGTVLASQAYGAIGMAYMEQNDKAKAIEYFKKATANKEDVLVTPLYLYHLGIAYQANGQNNEAKEAFKRIRDEYPRSLYARDMDKELARLGELN